MVELEWPVRVRFEGVSLSVGIEVVSVSVTTFLFLTSLFLTVTVFALLDVRLEVEVVGGFSECAGLFGCGWIWRSWQFLSHYRH